MSNSLNVAATASDIIEKLSEAKHINDDNKENSGFARAQSNLATLGGYAIAMVAIRQLLDQGVWTSGKQKGGAVSASAALQNALVAEAKAKEIAPSKAKRLIEKSALIVVPGAGKGDVHVAAVHIAAAQSTDAVLKALDNAGFKKEADIINHVEPKEVDIVARITKAVSKLENKDRAGFIKELCNHEIIDDILKEANKITAEERENQRRALAEAKKKAAEPKKSVVKKDAVAKGKADAKAAKADKAQPVPKSGGSKKGASTKAKAADVTDPFAA